MTPPLHSWLLSFSAGYPSVHQRSGYLLRYDISIRPFMHELLGEEGNWSGESSIIGAGALSQLSRYATVWENAQLFGV